MQGTEHEYGAPVMSIYQLRSKRPISELVSQPGTHGGTPAPACPPPRVQDRAQERSHLRKAKPANYLLPMSLDWLSHLPSNVRPRALLTHFPRIANLVALQWNNPATCRAYFDDLLIDHRGTRKGFPADVRRELLALRDYYYSLHLTMQE